MHALKAPLARCIVQRQGPHIPLDCGLIRGRPGSDELLRDVPAAVLKVRRGMRWKDRRSAA